jgi:hypothetical protein
VVQGNWQQSLGQRHNGVDRFFPTDGREGNPVRPFTSALERFEALMCSMEAAYDFVAIYVRRLLVSEE